MRTNCRGWSYSLALVVLAIGLATGFERQAVRAAGERELGGQVHRNSVPTSWSRPEPRAAVGGAVVIGTDERLPIDDTTQLPFRLIALLELYDADDEFIGHCTGTLVGPDSVLTAAHCLYDVETDTFTQSIRVVPGATTDSEPYDYDWAANSWVPDGWISTGGAPEWDWGVIDLDSTYLSENVGGWWFKIAVFQDETLEHEQFLPAIVGYPGDKEFGSMWGDVKERFVSVGPEMIRYDIDTAAGESGSAVFSANLDEWFGLMIAAVHVRGGDLNEATRIDDFVLDDLDIGCQEMGCIFEYYVEEETTPDIAILRSHFCGSYSICDANQILRADYRGLAFFELTGLPQEQVTAEAKLNGETWTISWNPPPYNSARFNTGDALGVLPSSGMLTLDIYVGDDHIGTISSEVRDPLPFQVVAPGAARSP